MKPTNYDALLQKIYFFQIHPHLIPYIGDRYEKYKILHVAESHYLNQTESNMRVHINDFIDDWFLRPCEDLIEGCENWVDTRAVVKNFLAGIGRNTTIMNVLKPFCRIVLSKEGSRMSKEERECYQYFSFMNYFQMPSLLSGKKYWKSLEYDSKLCTGNKESAYEMWNKCVQKSDAVLDAVIDILEPTMIVFTSLSAGKAYSGRYKNDKRTVYTSHPQSPVSWNKPLKSLQNKTGKEVYEHALKKFYCKGGNLKDEKDSAVPALLYDGFDRLSGSNRQIKSDFCRRYSNESRRPFQMVGMRGRLRRRSQILQGAVF